MRSSPKKDILKPQLLGLFGSDTLGFDSRLHAVDLKTEGATLHLVAIANRLITEVSRHDREDAREVRVAGTEVRVVIIQTIRQDNLDSVKPWIYEEETSRCARMSDSLHSVDVGEILTKADVAGLGEEGGRAVELRLKAAAEKRIDALRGEDTVLARAANVEKMAAELDEVRSRDMKPRLPLVRGKRGMVHSKRTEDAVTREVSDIRDARHLLADLRENVVALRHVAELLVHLELLEHRVVELLMALRVDTLRDMPRLVAPPRGVRHQVDDRYILALELGGPFCP